LGPLPIPDPPLTDERVRVRPWSEADVSPGLIASRDPLVPRFTRVPEDQTEGQLRAFIGSRANGEALSLVIADAGTDEFLGAVGLMRFDWPERRAEIGYWLAPAARGRGVATRAVRLLSGWALSELGLMRLALHADTDNLASQRVAERCGFTREGLLRSYEERNGRRYDLVVFSLLREDLQPD
jgi:RimJ/RimL family protein N-acetyltransferase